MQKPDFSGYVTKAGLVCTDGRTIMPEAFKHQDQAKVPLVWQHGHGKPENVLGHVILEHRDDGVYGYGFFNETPQAQSSRQLLEHGDINMMSIWANQLVEKAKQVFHGMIREVSLVLSGANPGALIDNVVMRHDGFEEELEDEAIITTGLLLEHEDMKIEHGEGTDMGTENGDTNTIDLEAVFASFDDDQKAFLHAAMQSVSASDDVDDDDVDTDAEGDDDTVIHSGDRTIKDIYESMTQEQKDVLHYMVGEAAASAGKNVKQDNLESDNTEGNEMTHNVFDQTTGGDRQTISHDDMQSIVASAAKGGSFADAVNEYAMVHGINDIDVLFPDAQMIQDRPEMHARRTEWVSKLLGMTQKSPFNRIKTLYADITEDEARAKGYIKGNLKKEEFFNVAKRTTTPTTIYKKQKLDRDDMIDITDFDIVAWLKAEMRLMLDEEIARAILLGDGRDIAHEDKINEQNIRPIASDHELYSVQININIDDANSSMQEIVDAIVLNRHSYKGSGMPTFWTTEYYIARFLLLKDTVGRRIYKNLDELATEIRVKEVVPVEVMEEYDDMVGVIVNPSDYVVGATAGGKVSMFDDFDIDYNQHKYLIETRMCGALTKLKSALVIRKTESTAVLVASVEPDFNPANGELTITDVTGVTYKDGDDNTLTNAGSPYTVASGDTIVVTATADNGYFFASSEDSEWSFTAD